MATKKSLTIRKAQKLELRPAKMRSNLLALLEQVEKNQSTREAFIKNPTKLITAKVTKTKVTTQQVSEANRLLFALIANDKMLSWLSRYEPPKGKGAKQAFATEFAKQIAALGDKNILTALVGNAMVGNGIPGMSQVAYQCVCRETTGKQSTTCTPVSKASQAFDDVIQPEVIRSVSEALVARAKSLTKKGVIADLDANVGLEG